MLGHAFNLSGNTKALSLGCYQAASALFGLDPAPLSAKDTIMGVWPECFMLETFINVVVSEREAKENWEWVEKFIRNTRTLIDTELARPSGDPDLEEHIETISAHHYETELRLYIRMLQWFTQKEMTYGVVFRDKAMKRYNEIVKKDQSKVITVDRYVDLLVDHGTYFFLDKNYEKAFEILSRALELCETDPLLHKILGLLYLRRGEIEEGLKSLEIFFSSLREHDSRVETDHWACMWEKWAEVVTGKLLSQMDAGPNTLWALKVAGITLTPEQAALVKENTGVKKNVRCLNCDVQLAKVYKCSRCDIATYCGTECQRKGWISHKEVCNPDYSRDRVKALLESAEREKRLEKEKARK
jgi:tetratricopeptide (TPR) repeat protein